jgi:hypothetical protein
MTDISAAAWVEERLRWWPERITPRAVVPGEHEAYIRIFHRASRIEDDVGNKRWVELAAERGKVMHPLVHFEALVGGRGPEEVDDWDELVPLEELSVGEATALAGVLAGFTGGSDRCWFLLWDGYGHRPWPDDRVWTKLPTLGDRTALLSPESAAREVKRAEAFDRIPRARTWWNRGEPSAPGREYHLIGGSLEDIARFHFDGWWQSPNIWWPEDRAWCVASEVDGYDTFVGGSRACIQAVLDSEGLEALPIAPDAEFGPVDPMNPAPWDP